MWLTSSSIGRKFVMAITGICLVLFVTFHCVMNTVAIAWPTAYNVICEFLGANWYALIASAGLAVLFILHIIYASWLTIQNRRARGNDRYEVTSRPPQVEWSSKNMYVLGIVILAFLVVHLIQFWAKMQWQEIIGHVYSVNGVTYAPMYGTLFLQEAFKQVFTPIVYIIGFVALWFHMNHGFWSMLHSVGWDNNVWIERLKKIGCVWTTVVVLLYVAQAIVFTVKAHNEDYTKDVKLQEQYIEYWASEAEGVIDEFHAELVAINKEASGSQFSANQAVYEAIAKAGEKMQAIAEAAHKQCPDAVSPELNAAFGEMQQYMQYLQYQQQQPMSEDEGVDMEAEVVEEEVALN